MTTKRKSFSDDFNKSFNLYTISASDIDPDNPNPDNPNSPEDDCEFTYLKIPCRYKCVYIKLLTKLNDLGIDMLNDCTAVCGGKNKFIITCWNMFQAAIASYELGDIKKADLLINYIKAQLKLECSSSTGEQTKTNMIYFGQTDDIDANTFSTLNVYDVFALNKEFIEIKGSDINEITKQQTSKLHFLIIPVDLVDLIEVNYKVGDLIDYLWNGDESTSTYKSLPNVEEIDGIKCKVYFTYSLENINLNINIKIKNK